MEKKWKGMEKLRGSIISKFWIFFRCSQMYIQYIMDIGAMEH